MDIIGISIGSEETSACIVNSLECLGNVIPSRDLVITGDKRIIPTLLSMTKEGIYRIPSSAYDYSNSVEIWRSFIAPLDTITSEVRRIFRSYITELYSLIFSNNPFIHEDYQIYLNIDTPHHWTISQINELEFFLRNECGVSFTEIVKTRNSLVCGFKHCILSGFRNLHDKQCIVQYTDKTLRLIYFNPIDNTILESCYPLGANRIDKIVFDYLLSENPQNRENIEHIKREYPEVEVTARFLECINEWKYQMELFYSQRPFTFPEIPLSSIVLNKSYNRGLYFETSDSSSITYNTYKAVLSSYIVNIYDAFRDFKHRCNNELPSFVYATGKACRFHFFQEIVSDVYNVLRGESLFSDLNPEMSLARGTAVYGYSSIMGKI